MAYSQRFDADQSDASQPATFVATRQLAFLDHFRVPHAVDPATSHAGTNCVRAGHAALIWPATPGPDLVAGMIRGEGDRGIPFFARIQPDDAVRELLPGDADAWSPARAVVTTDGSPLGSIWRAADGSVFFPFDPDEVIANYWSERYLQLAGSSRARKLARILMVAYYRVRPLLPRALQIWMRRRVAPIQARARFPRWPIETGLHDFFELLLAILADISGDAVPYIAAWPTGHTWALVLTHDVELDAGWRALDPVLELEHAHGLRSSWNLVPLRYQVSDERVRELIDLGHEVGVHGLYHDGRDLSSVEMLRERLPGMRAAAERWDAVGFRSPALHRRAEWMPLLGFDYDSSSPDTDPFEPQPGGCCTWLPFFNEGMVELPVTLTQDHTLYVILGHRDEAAWVSKTEFLRDRGGMALLDTHPDYLVSPRVLHAYSRLLERYAADPTAWTALPREVSAWWRRRAASRLERDGDGWKVVGPAADEARVAFASGTWR